MILGIHPYLVTDGRAKEAIAFYQEAIDAKVLLVQTFDDMPPNPDFSIPAGSEHLVINAHLKVADSDLMISDNCPGLPLQQGDQVTISLTTNDVEDTREIFSRLQVGGQVIMELEETFWSPLYGQVKDKFGVTWQMNTFIDQK